VAASSDPDTATAQTIAIMCGHVRKASSDEVVKQTAGRAAQQFAGLAGTDGQDAYSLVTAAFWWCKVFVKFVHHELIIRQHLGEAGHLQGLISPEILVRMQQPEGDCAIFTECVCAFLRVFGISYEIITVAVNPQEPESFSHVYLYAVLPDGTRMPIDASHGGYPGWQVPSSHVSRRQVWDAAGNPIADQGSRFDGLHNYGLRGGLGDVCDPSAPDFDLSACDLLSAAGQLVACSDGTMAASAAGCPAPAIVGNSVLCSDGVTWAPSAASCPSGQGSIAYTAPSGTPANNSAQWAAFSTALLKSGLTLAEIQAIQPGTVVSANGAILRQSTGVSVGTSLGTMSTSTLLIGGVVILVLLMSMGKR
jgi:hypothetical protein